MRPGPTIISECYKCHGLFKQWTLSSGNTFTAQFWPDGFMKAPMMPEMPALFHCPSCEEFIWRRDCKEIDEVHGYDEMKEKYPEVKILLGGNGVEVLDFGRLPNSNYKTNDVLWFN